MDLAIKFVKLKCYCWQPSMYCVLLTLFIIQAMSTASVLKNVYLNSYGHCGHDKTFEVSPELGYLVRGDISPSTNTKSFRDCETNFYSKRSRLCLVQEGRVNEIDDLNAELLVHDGYDTEDSPLVFSLKHEPGQWKQREYCTKSHYLNIYLRKVNKTALVDARKVYINLKVLDIESKGRRLYLNDLYCDQTYQLLNSRVSIYNRPHQNLDPFARNLTQTCSIKLEKEKTDNKSICFVYVPSDHITCHSNSDWIISVTESQNTLYSLRCKDENAKQWHAWCSSNTTYSVTFALQRADVTSFNLSLERPETFRFVFADYQGTSESFLEEVKRDLLMPSDSSGLNAGWIIFIVLLVAVVMGTVALVYWKREVLPCMQYKSVHNPGNLASV